jgi:hypothetical protein
MKKINFEKIILWAVVIGTAVYNAIQYILANAPQ